MSDSTPLITEQLSFLDVPSPCRGVCESNSRGYCKGCFRSREERQLWISMTDSQKQQVLWLCRRRERAALQRKAAESATTAFPATPDLFDLS